MTYQGIPFRGPIPTIQNKNDYEQPTLDYEVHAQTFDLSDPVQAEEYRKVCESLMRQKAVLMCEHTMPNPEKHSWVKHMTWATKFYRMMTQSEKRDFLGIMSL